MPHWAIMRTYHFIIS